MTKAEEIVTTEPTISVIKDEGPADNEISCIDKSRSPSSTARKNTGLLSKLLGHAKDKEDEDKDKKFVSFENPFFFANQEKAAKKAASKATKEKTAVKNEETQLETDPLYYDDLTLQQQQQFLKLKKKAAENQALGLKVFNLFIFW